MNVEEEKREVSASKPLVPFSFSRYLKYELGRRRRREREREGDKNILVSLFDRRNYLKYHRALYIKDIIRPIDENRSGPRARKPVYMRLDRYLR